MREEQKEMLQKLCLAFCSKLIDLLYSIQTGRPEGPLPCTEILTTLYHGLMDMDLMNPEKEDRDHLIPSESHGVSTLYLVLAYRGFSPVDELKNLRQMGSMLQDHPCVCKTPGVELSTSPLNLGLSAELEMALGARLKGYDSYTYVIMGDGEIQEGCIWEVATPAPKFKANHLIGILDNDGIQSDGILEDIMPMGDIRTKWEAFRWSVTPCGDHDVENICRTMEEAKMTADKPSLVLAGTVRRKGVSFIEGKNIWHGKTTRDQGYAQAKTELGGKR